MTPSFSKELARFGPNRDYPVLGIVQARRYCRRLAKTHYENFTVASLLLPRRLVPHFHHVYAYCRWADDLADETSGGQPTLTLLRWWRDELLECYAGRPRHPVFVALRQTINHFSIPPSPFLDLLTAFEQDQVIKRYRTYEELLGYCKNSANPVGRLVLYLCGAHDPIRAVLSDFVCTALQLANFWQDVARDFANGRVYLPQEDRQQFGVTDEDLQALQCTRQFVELMRFEVERTRTMFQKGLPLVQRMPAETRLDIELFIRGGLAILGKIEDVGYNVLDSRPALTKWEKARLVGQVLWRQMRTLWW